MSTPPARTSLAYALLGFTMVIWASAFAGIRVALIELSPLTLTSIRMIIAAVALGLVGAIARIKAPEPRDLPAICVAGLTGFSLYHLALNFGLVHVTAGQAGFIIATTPIWTALLAWRFLKERVTVKTWVGLAMGVVGVGIMSLSADDAKIEMGALLVLASAMFAAMNITLQKNLLKRYRALDLAIHVTIAGSLPFLCYMPWALPELQALSLKGWLVTTYLGLIPIALGYVLSIIALSILPANRSAQMMLLVPPIAALIAWIWIGEQPGSGLLIGGSLILAGVLLGGLKPRKNKAIRKPKRKPITYPR